MMQVYPARPFTAPQLMLGSKYILVKNHKSTPQPLLPHSPPLDSLDIAAVAIGTFSALHLASHNRRCFNCSLLIPFRFEASNRTYPYLLPYPSLPLIPKQAFKVAL